MSTINFPTNPTLNELYSFGTRTWQWNGSAWVLTASGIIGPQGPTGPQGTTGPLPVGYATTGSNTFIGNQIISGSLAVTEPITGSLNGNALTATSASYAQTASYATTYAPVPTIFETVYAGENITKGDPLYISGSQGANPTVYKADAANPAKMPVIFISNETINAGNTTSAIVLGLIDGIDLTGYEAGTDVYVAAGGGWTATRPTGSAIVQVLGFVAKGGSGGKGLVLNPGPVDLPNLPQNNIWIGNASSYPVTQSKSEFIAGLYSSSAQVTYSGISGVPAGIISSSAQLPAGTVSSSAQITSLTSPILSGSSIITGSIRGNVVAVTLSSNTGSFDLSTGNFFTVTLASGSGTRLNFTNFNIGQTANILVTTNAASTASFGSGILQPSGSSYVASTSGSKDALTLVTWDTGSAYLVAVNRMI